MAGSAYSPPVLFANPKAPATARRLTQKQAAFQELAERVRRGDYLASPPTDEEAPMNRPVSAEFAAAGAEAAQRLSFEITQLWRSSHGLPPLARPAQFAASPTPAAAAAAAPTSRAELDRLLNLTPAGRAVLQHRDEEARAAGQTPAATLSGMSESDRVKFLAMSSTGRAILAAEQKARYGL